MFGDESKKAKAFLAMQSRDDKNIVNKKYKNEATSDCWNTVDGESIFLIPLLRNHLGFNSFAMVATAVVFWLMESTLIFMSCSTHMVSYSIVID